IGYNKSENEVRQRFTIAHEIGHYFLHRLEHEIFYDKKDASKLYRNHNSSTGEDQMEREANAFAAALLMPKNRLKLEIEKMQFDLGSDKDQILEKLAATFKVSNQAMMYRILNLRLL
ncbi:MAG TPA: ImmA/IrrE family metallo-endopeptidase, partial [Vicingaceae bacterium]|nr:ImmA/IrrE family metallo-endopeptidase [Vicingaceae bacterium]